MQRDLATELEKAARLVASLQDALRLANNVEGLLILDHIGKAARLDAYIEQLLDAVKADTK